MRNGFIVVSNKRMWFAFYRDRAKAQDEADKEASPDIRKTLGIIEVKRGVKLMHPDDPIWVRTETGWVPKKQSEFWSIGDPA